MDKEAQEYPGYAPPQQNYRHKVHVRIDDALYQKLRMYTAQSGTTIQQLLESLIRNAVS